MPGRKKKSAAPKKEKPLFTEEETNTMLCNMIASMVGADKVTGFILVAEDDKQDYMKVHNMNSITCLGYAEKISLWMKNRMLIQMVGADEDYKRKQKRTKKRSNN